VVAAAAAAIGGSAVVVVAAGVAGDLDAEEPAWFSPVDCCWRVMFIDNTVAGLRSM